MSHDNLAHLTQIHEPGPDCPSFAELLPVLDDEVIDPNDAAPARAHLATCDYCQMQRAAYALVEVGLRRHFGAALTAPLAMEEFMSTNLDESDSDSDTGAAPRAQSPTPATPPRSRRRRVLSGFAALAAVLVVSLLAAILFISHPRGAPVSTQQPFAVPTGASLFMTGVSMVSSDEGWAIAHYTPSTNGDGTPIGNDKPTAFLFHFHNGAWTRVNVPVSASDQQLQLNAISLDSPADGWAVGSVVANGQLGALLLHYDGRAWSKVSTTIPSNLGAVHMLSAADGWALSGLGSDAAIYHYDGTSWTPQSVPAASIAGQRYSLQLYGLSITSTTDGWAVGAAIPPAQTVGSTGSPTSPTYGVILHYTGGTWQLQQTIPSAIFSGIAMDAPGDGWAVGVDVPAQQTTSDSGQSSSPSPHMLLLHYTAGHWVKVTVTVADPQRLTGGFGSIIMSSPTDGWIMGHANGSSTNPNSFELLHFDGTSWTEVASPNVKGRSGYAIAGSEINGISVPAPDDVWAVGDANLTPTHYTVGPQGSGPIITGLPVIMRYHNGAWTIYTS